MNGGPNHPEPLRFHEVVRHRVAFQGIAVFVTYQESVRCGCHVLRPGSGPLTQFINRVRRVSIGQQPPCQRRLAVWVLQEKRATVHLAAPRPIQDIVGPERCLVATTGAETARFAEPFETAILPCLQFHSLMIGCLQYQVKHQIHLLFKRHLCPKALGAV